MAARSDNSGSGLRHRLHDVLDDAVKGGLALTPALPSRVKAVITPYEKLTVKEIRGALGDLSPAELREVRARERHGKARKGVLDEVERQLKRKR